MDHRFNRFLRATLLGSRWGMAPFIFGLIAALLLVMAQFFRDLVKAVLGFPELGSADVMVVALKLVDLVLVANLILLIVTAGIATFAPRPADADGDTAQLGGIADFAELKLKVFASIAAIAGVDLLEHVIYIDTVDKTGVLVRIVVLLAFVVAGLALAWMDRLTHRH